MRPARTRGVDGGDAVLFGRLASRLATGTARHSAASAPRGVPDQPGEDGISYTVRARVILEPHDGICAAGIGLLELERERWFGPGQVKAQFPHP